MTTTNTRDKSVPTTKKTSEYISDSGIRVKVTYPDAVSESVRRQKINRMYDILTGAMCSTDNAENSR